MAVVAELRETEPEGFNYRGCEHVGHLFLGIRSYAKIRSCSKQACSRVGACSRHFPNSDRCSDQWHFVYEDLQFIHAYEDFRTPYCL